MKDKYIKPAFEIEEFKTVDVVTTSRIEVNIEELYPNNRL